MKPIRFDYFPLRITAIFLSTIQLTLSQTGSTQQNTIFALETASVPLVDGQGDDCCWQNISWQSIGENWISTGQRLIQMITLEDSK